VFYLDEDLDGPTFSRPLTAASIEFIRHRDLFPQGAADVSWIPVVTRRGVIILSANTGMLFKPLEVQAIRNSGARILYLHQGAGGHVAMADIFVRSQRVVARFFSVRTTPRVGVLRRQPPSKDPDSTKPRYIAVPQRFA